MQRRRECDKKLLDLPTLLSVPCICQVTHQEPIDLAPTLSVRGQPQKLSMPNLAKLTFKQHAGIYKVRYITPLQWVSAADTNLSSIERMS